MRTLIFVVSLTAIGCGGSEAPSTPSRVPAGPVALHTTLTDTASGAAIGVSEQTVTTFPARLTFSAPGHLDRTTTLRSAAATVDLIGDAGPFDLTFYRQFVRNGFEAPTSLEPFRRQQSGVRLYLRTVDETGNDIDSVTLDTVANAMTTQADDWNGGRFGVTVERGTETREGTPGWITVKFLNPMVEGICGRASVGGTYIELNYLNSLCGCNGSKVRPRTARHELGHAMGFWHTGSAEDLLSGLADGRCNQAPSVRERYHAAIAYSRQNGNTDIDVDATGISPQSTRSSERLVVD